MSVNERASLETTRAPFPSSFCAESRPICDRPVTRTRAPIHKHLRRHEPYAARAADNHHLLPWYRSLCILLAGFELFCIILRRGGCG
jgi:hypothetical protein